MKSRHTLAIGYSVCYPQVRVVDYLVEIRGGKVLELQRLKINTGWEESNSLSQVFQAADKYQQVFIRVRDRLERFNLVLQIPQHT